jgi:hypothetical protein
VEKTAPAGFIPDPNTRTVDLVPGNSDKTITTAFVNNRPILKISGFGYTNSATGSPTSGIVSGSTTFTVNLHNYGLASTTLTNSSLRISVTGATAGTVTCTAAATPVPYTLTLTGTIAASSDITTPFSVTCTYSNLTDGAVITADLIVKYTTNNLEREASGSPARISFTVQAD